MNNTKRAGVFNIGLIGRNRRGVFLLITFLLMTGTIRAGQSQLHIVAGELQKKGDLVGAEKALQSALKKARAAGGRSVKNAGALPSLRVFFQEIGPFSHAESSFSTSPQIFRLKTHP